MKIEKFKRGILMNNTIKGFVNLNSQYGVCCCGSLVGVETTLAPIKGLIFRGCGNCLTERIKLYFMDESLEQH